MTSPTTDPASAPRSPEDASYRFVDLEKVGEHRFKATNARGGVLPVGHGEDPDFTPVELLLAGLAGCGALDLDFIAGKRAPFATFAARADGHKVRDEQGNRMVGLTVTFDVTFPEGPEGDAARAVLAPTLQRVQDRLCTVGRTVTVGDEVRYVEGPLSGS
ncbi:MAG TPA: OsmC family protein [Nocardioides sp.]|uniref:OsmC family protein n=1 Tax=Nocardioides sp. TaxID=35761 RepID=UPI002ED8F9A6